jgi:hypothetical protein
VKCGQHKTFRWKPGIFPTHLYDLLQGMAVIERIAKPGIGAYGVVEAG